MDLVFRINSEARLSLDTIHSGLAYFASIFYMRVTFLCNLFVLAIRISPLQVCWHGIHSLLQMEFAAIASGFPL